MIDFVTPIANGQTDLNGNRLIFIPSSWALGYYEIIRIQKQLGEEE